MAGYSIPKRLHSHSCYGSIVILSGVAMMEHDILFDKDWSDNFIKFRGVEKCNMILEAGCGNGMWTSTISILFQDSVVIAADIDTKAVRDSRRSLSDSRIDFVICDANHLPFIEGSFNFVTCRRLLMNLKRKKNALLEMKYALRTGGASFQMIAVRAIK